MYCTRYVFAHSLLACLLLSPLSNTMAQHPVEAPEYRPREIYKPAEPNRPPELFKPGISTGDTPHIDSLNDRINRAHVGDLNSRFEELPKIHLFPPIDLKSDAADKLSKVEAASSWCVAVRDSDGSVRYARNDLLEGTVASIGVPSETKWILNEPHDWRPSRKELAFEVPPRLPRFKTGEASSNPFAVVPLANLQLKAPLPGMPVNEINLDSKVGATDLTPFVEVNNRLGADFINKPPLFDERRNLLFRFFEAGMKPTLAMTSAKLADGSYMVSLFDLRQAAIDGRLVGQVFTIPATGDARLKELEASIRSSLESGSHLYVYGDVPQNLRLSSVISGLGAKVVRRTKWTQYNILTLEQRLQQLSSTPIDADSTVFVNALPATKDDAAVLGPLAGNSETWVDFHRRVSDLVASSESGGVEPDKLFSELNAGERNIVFIVAHATGLKLFLGGKAISIDELRKLPVRKEKSVQPRMAVLMVCNAGEEKTPSRWSFFHKDIPNLADVLLAKGYFDVVIAPDHPIEADETIGLMQRIYAGGANAKLPAGWTRRSSVPHRTVIRGG